MSQAGRSEVVVAEPRALRIRLGVALVGLSWLPIAQLIIAIGSLAGSEAKKVRLGVWGVQILVGILGVAVAGKPTVDVARRVGWRRAPRVLWGLLWRGRAEPAATGT